MLKLTSGLRSLVSTKIVREVKGGVGYLVRKCLVNEVEFINTVKYEESVWMKVHSERRREALYVGCVYMLTDITSVSVMDSCYDRFKEDVT